MPDLAGKETLGVDVGGVILDFVPQKGRELDFSGDRYLETPEVEGAIEAIGELNRGRFKDAVHLVSRVHNGPERVLAWLRHRDFFARTGIPESRFHHCVERREKAPIVQTLGITHFVDDRAEVLKEMIGIVPYLYQFQGLDEDGDAFAPQVPGLRFARSWAEVLELLKR